LRIFVFILFLFQFICINSLGKHERETLNPVHLEKGEAIFDERLNIPATLFYVKKKDKYLPKEVSNDNVLSLTALGFSRTPYYHTKYEKACRSYKIRYCPLC